MNQRQIVFEHRDALDKFAAAKIKKASCARKGTCKDAKYCLTCPARLEKERCERILEEKSAPLKALNDSIVEKNTQEALQMRVNREQVRKAKKERVTSLKVGVKQSMKKQAPSKPVYEREELTAERFRQHKEEGKTDRVIREMYGIPKGSFSRVKTDLIAQLKPSEEQVEVAATTEEVPTIESENSEVVPVEKPSEPESDVSLRQKLAKVDMEKAIIVDQQEQSVKAMDELQRQLIEANNLLTTEQQYTAELKRMVDYLENQLRAKEEATTVTTAISDNPAPDYQGMYEQTKEELEKLKIVAQDRSQRIESLEYQLSDFIESNNNQTSKFREYEILLLERLLQELYAGRN